MNRFFGKIGFCYQESEEGSDIVTERVVLKTYRGDLLKSNRKWETAEQIIDQFNISNRVSIMADPYSLDNLYAIKFVILHGKAWKITDAEIQYPRIILSIGGLWNGPVDETPV